MADARGNYQILINEDSSSESAGGDIIDTASQKLPLNYYSRLLYFITKETYLALGNGMSVAGAKPKLSEELKNESRKDAIARANGSVISRSVNVFRGRSGLTDELKDKDGVEKLVMGSGATFMDFIITIFRSFGQVAADVWQRGDNVSDGSQDNPDSVYTQTMFHNGNPQLGQTRVGEISTGAALAALIAGMGRGWYQVEHKKTLKGNADFSKKAGLKEDEIEDLLDERLRQAMKEGVLSVYPTLQPQGLAKDRKTFLDDMIEAVDDFYDTDTVHSYYDKKNKIKFSVPLAEVKALKAKLKFAQENQLFDEVESTRAELVELWGKIQAARKPRYVRFAATAYRVISAVSSALWDRLSTLSYIFWLTWMPVVMIYGLAAASGPMLPVVLLITASLGLVFTVLKLAHLNPLKILFPESVTADVKQDEAPVEATDTVKAEFERLAHATKSLTFIDQESMGIATSLNVKVDARPRHAYSNPAAQSELRERLLGSIHARRGRVVIAGFRGFLSGLLTVVFIGWLSSAALGFLGAAVVANFIGSTAFGGILGGIAGIYNSISTMSLLRKSQLSYEKKVDTVLQSSYRGTGETKADAFQRLYEQVETRKQLVEKYLADNKAQIVRPAHFDQLDDASKALFESNVAKHKALKAYLAKIDVFNDRYFEKFEHEESGFTILKKVLNRAYEFTFASQTGAFAARFSFLKGGLLAGALGFSVLAGMWPFLIAAGALMLLVGTVALIDYQMKADQEHRENFVNTLDARLYYLETKNNELFAVQVANNIFKNDASELEAVIAPAVKLEVKPGVSLDASSILVEANDLAQSDSNVPNVSALGADESLSVSVVADRDAKSIPALQQASLFAATGHKVRMQKAQLAERPLDVAGQLTRTAPAP